MQQMSLLAWMVGTSSLLPGVLLMYWVKALGGDGGYLGIRGPSICFIFIGVRV